MDPATWDKLTDEELVAEAAKFHLPTGGGKREDILRALKEHLEKHNAAKEALQKSSGGRRGSGDSSALTAAGMLQLMNKFFDHLQEQNRKSMEQMAAQQQTFMERIMSVSGGGIPMQSAANRSDTGSTRVSDGTSSASGNDRPRSPTANGDPARASVGGQNGANIKWIATQIPEFSGNENESVKAWIRRVDRVAGVHGATEEAVLLAASSKFTKQAKRWYDSQMGAALESWSDLKEALMKTFEIKLPYYASMKKIEARRWNWQKETFQQYALDKLALTANTEIVEEDKINLLINGINNSSLRATASLIEANTVEQFLEKMRKATAASAEGERWNRPVSKPEKEKLAQTCQTCGKTGHSQQECRTGKLVCFHCNEKGHRRPDCPKLRRTIPVVPAATSSSAVAAGVTEEEEAEAEMVGVVAEVTDTESRQRKITISTRKISVSEINNYECDLSVLADTGSPASFASRRVFEHYLRNCASTGRDRRKFNGLNNLPITIDTAIETNIHLRELPGLKFRVLLNILSNNNRTGDIILGRDFFDENNVTLIYEPRKTENMRADESDESEQTVFLALANIDIKISESSHSKSLNDLQTDCAGEDREKLHQLLSEIQQSEVPIIEDGYTVKINLKDASEYAYAPRRFAHEERRQIRVIIDDLLKRGIIKTSTSPYCARIVPVRKKNGTLRLCVDLRPLNSRVIKQKFPFPLIEDCIARLGNKKIFTLLDLRDGFHQIKVDPSCTKYFSFATPDGQYEYTRLPFGFSESPAEFQKRLASILQPLIAEDKVIVYIDDIMIATDTVEQNLNILKEVLGKLKEYGFELNREKSQFLKNEIEYLGYIISNQGITLSERHINSVKNFPRPENAHQIQRFLGLTSYFRKFIRDYANIAKPLYNLTRKTVKFDFDRECEIAFNQLKNILTNYPVLRIYDPTAETELHTDASTQGIAAILMQKQANGQGAPIAYYSQLTNTAEKNYHSFELEMLAIVRAIERFHIYLYGIDFSVVTDCNALVHAVNKAHINPRIARWTLLLQNYKFKIIHRPGHRMAHVDALSRQVAFVHVLPIERELEFRQLQDKRIQEIANNLEFKDDDKFALIDGLVYRKDEDRSRFVIPESMIHQLLKIHHDDLAHCGLEKTYQSLHQTYWFPGMRKRIRDYIDNCVICLMANSSSHANEGEMQELETPTRPCQILHVDHLGPLPISKRGSKHVFLVVDAFTRFTWLFAKKSTTTREILNDLTSLFNMFGRPSEIVSDRGTGFTSGEFESFLEKWGVYHRKVAVASPWANGLAERINRFIINSFKRTISEPELWEDSLGTIQYVINNTFHTAIKNTPAKLFLGLDQQNHTDKDFAQYVNALAQTDRDIEKERNESQNIGQQTTQKIREYNKAYYDKSHKQPTTYRSGEYVLLRDTQNKPGESRKFKAAYKGPYMVDKVLRNNRYVIKDIPGFNITQKPLNTVVSSDKIKPWVKTFSDVEQVKKKQTE